MQRVTPLVLAGMAMQAFISSIMAAIGLIDLTSAQQFFSGLIFVLLAGAFSLSNK